MQTSQKYFSNDYGHNIIKANYLFSVILFWAKQNMPRGISKRQLGTSRYSMSIYIINIYPLSSHSFELLLAQPSSLPRFHAAYKGSCILGYIIIFTGWPHFYVLPYGYIEIFEVFIISRFSWVADDTKIIHVEGGINPWNCLNKAKCTKSWIAWNFPPVWYVTFVNSLPYI